MMIFMFNTETEKLLRNIFRFRRSDNLFSSIESWDQIEKKYNLKKNIRYITQFFM